MFLIKWGQIENRGQTPIVVDLYNSLFSKIFNQGLSPIFFKAWRAVQQEHGGGTPAMEMKGKVDINRGKEKQADVMGKKGFQFGDNRPEADQLRELQDDIHNGSTKQKRGLSPFNDRGCVGNLGETRGRSGWTALKGGRALIRETESGVIQRELKFDGDIKKEEKEGFREDMTREEAESVLKGKKHMLGEKELGLHFRRDELKGVVAGGANVINKTDVDSLRAQIDDNDWGRDVFSHNHPSDSPLTDSDMSFAFNNRYREVRAVTSNRVWRCWYMREKIVDKDARFAKIHDHYATGGKKWNNDKGAMAWVKKSEVTDKNAGQTFNLDKGMEKLYGLLEMNGKGGTYSNAAEHQEAYKKERESLYEKRKKIRGTRRKRSKIPNRGRRGGSM